MKHLMYGVLCVLLVGGGAGAAEAGQGRNGGRGAPAPSSDQHASKIHATASVRFETEHVQAIRRHYAGQQRQLPRGLQKKYARTGQLPPGWQKKMEPIPVRIERSLPPLPAGHGRGIIDGHAVIYNSTSGLIVDVAVLF